MTYATRNRAFITLMNEAEIAIRRNLLGWHPLIECPVGPHRAVRGLPGRRGRP